MQNVVNLVYQLENFHRRTKAVEPAVERSKSHQQLCRTRPQGISLSMLDQQLSQLTDQIDGLFEFSGELKSHVAEMETALAQLRQKLGARFLRAPRGIGQSAKVKHRVKRQLICCRIRLAHPYA